MSAITRRSPKGSDSPDARSDRRAAVPDGKAADSPAAATRGQGATSAIIRRRLLERMSVEPRPRVILVIGPAGYGKTSLLRQHCEWRAGHGERVAWVRMDAQSSDAAHFLRMLREAVDSLAERPARARRRVDRPTTLQDLLRSIARVDAPLVLVIDNFEVAAIAEFEAVFAQVVRSLPESVQLCVGSRVLPAAQLARLQLYDAVTIANDELCFRPSETMAFFREFPGMQPSEIAEIHERTDGWPAALQAFRLCLRRGARFQAEVWAGMGLTRELMDFLATEIFDNLSPEQQSLLLELSIPEKLSADMVETITGEDDGAGVLAEIERSGLFLAQVDMGGHWLRFHNLFRHYLLERAKQAFPKAELHRRHRRVAAWYAANGHVEAAIGHWLEAGDTRRAAREMATIADGLIAQERLGMIETYANQLPMEVLLEHGNLVRAAVIAYGFRRAFDKAEQLLDLHRRKLEAENADADEFAMHNFASLFVLAGQDRIEELGEVAERTAELLSDHGGFPYGVTFNARSLRLLGRAQFEEARSFMMQARPLHDRAGNLFGQAYQDAIFSMSLSGQGRITDATRALEAAQRNTERRAHGSVSAGSVTAAYLVCNLYEQDRLDEARRFISDYGQLVEQQAIADAVATMDLTRARITHGVDGQRGEAEEVLERMIYLGYRHDLGRLVVYAHAELARMATLEGELGQAERWLAELPASCRELPRDELVFHAGETEALTVTWVRWLIRAGRHAEARQILGEEIRTAAATGRRRRELKLHLMNALAFKAAGRSKLAGRSLLDALAIAAPGGFVRSLLDEGPPLIALMKDLHAQQTPESRGSGGNVADDPVMSCLHRLLQHAGEATGGALLAPREQVDAEAKALLGNLTESERRLLRFVSAGLSNKDLAHRLSLSTNTVKWHLRNIFEKLHIKNRVQAVALSRRFGLID